LAVDRHVAEWVVRHRAPGLDWLFVGLSRIGTAGFVWVLLAILLALATRRPAFLLAAPAVFAADLLALAVKVAVQRPRPHLDPLVRVPTDDSFPSGHASTSFAGATLLSGLAPRLAPAFYLLAAAIAFSRVYVGVHYPVDVLAGAVIGTLVGLLVLRAPPLLGAARRRSRPETRPG
jgi:undecaprenyl-diphosphatase